MFEISIALALALVASIFIVPQIVFRMRLKKYEAFKRRPPTDLAGFLWLAKFCRKYEKECWVAPLIVLLGQNEHQHLCVRFPRKHTVILLHEEEFLWGKNYQNRSLPTIHSKGCAGLEVRIVLITDNCLELREPNADEHIGYVKFPW